MKNSDPHQPASPDTDTPRVPDLRVAAALDEIGCPYDLDEEHGSYSINVQLDEHRSQGVFIGSQTDFFMDVELRKILSIGLTSEGPFDPRTTNLLLMENGDLKLGSWSIVVEGDIHYALFHVTTSATINPRVLGELITFVAGTADKLEERLTGLDEF